MSFLYKSTAGSNSALLRLENRWQFFILLFTQKLFNKTIWLTMFLKQNFRGFSIGLPTFKESTSNTFLMHFKCIHLPTSYFQKQDKCWEAPKRVYSMPLFICLAAKRILKHVPKVTQFPQALIRRCQLLDEFVFQSGLNFANLECQMVEQFKYSEKSTKISRIFPAKLSLNVICH